MRLGHDCEHDRERKRLQIELVKLQEWIRLTLALADPV